LTIISPEKTYSTQQNIKVLSTHSGVFYYAVYINQTLTPTCDQIATAGKKVPTYSIFDPTQVQYGQVFIESANTATTFLVKNLQANGVYMVSGCLQSQMGTWTPIKRKGFQMQDNNSTILRVNVTFSQQPSNAALEKLCCNLT
jgi:hypothetical protein